MLHYSPMQWIAFCYSLPAKEGSSPRVTLWRRLRRLGALSVAGGVQILPDSDECNEAFQWLAQEIRTAKGEAAVMSVVRVEGLTDQQIVTLFNSARTEDYHALENQAKELGKTVTSVKESEKDFSQGREKLARLRRRYDEIARIDYFDCPAGKQIASLLNDLEQAISPTESTVAPIPKVNIEEYREKTWVTRPHPHVDRLACIWLIRRFVNRDAVIRYSNEIKKGEVGFDMDQGEFGHRGNLCTFENIRLAFALDTPALRAISEIVHEIDLHDDRYAWPETAGVETLLKGWTQTSLPDTELESKGIALFEGLYTAFLQRK